MSPYIAGLLLSRGGQTLSRGEKSEIIFQKEENARSGWAGLPLSRRLSGLEFGAL
jgi:hypothetical protein